MVEQKMNLLQEYNQKHIGAVTAERPGPISAFAPGDTIKVFLKVTDGTTERVQSFEGVCIARKNNSISSTFTIRKMSFGIGVERILPLYSPLIDKIMVMKRGRVRRAKLYYLRALRGKAARIKEKMHWLLEKK
ncbi:50S ribosomal protein L19 [Alphaproteobacteria bacterium]